MEFLLKIFIGLTIGIPLLFLYFLLEAIIIKPNQKSPEWMDAASDFFKWLYGI